MLKALFATILVWNSELSAKVHQSKLADIDSLSSQEKIVLSTLWLKAGHKNNFIEDKSNADESKKEEIKKIDPPVAKVTPIPEPTPTPAPVKKELSAGQKKVQEMLEANRRKLKEQRAMEKEEEVEANPNDLNAQYQKKLKELKTKVAKTQASWIEKRDETWSKWRQEREVFLTKLLPVFKEQTFNLESMAPQISQKKLDATVKRFPKEEIVLVKNSLSLEVRNQGQRPTCAAFAAIRAIESVLASQEIYSDLSEQYFYYASKPECQQRPCKERGSWVLDSIRSSQRSGNPDIPLEETCPYNPLPEFSNETQIPLKRTCNDGVVKVSDAKVISTLDEVVAELEKGRPVIAGFKLTPNFYETEGFVSLADSQKSGKTDQHAGGHAVTLVGLMRLPKEMRAQEGSYCLIANNSWGEGYGAGGYSCLSQKWIQKYRVRNAFISIASVEKN